jgi:hypothetical protein
VTSGCSSCSVCGHPHVVAWLLLPHPSFELCAECTSIEQQMSSEALIEQAMQLSVNDPEQRRLFALARWQIACARVAVLPERVR